MTVAENVAFGLRVKHRSQRPSEDQIQRKVHDPLVQLDWLADRYPAQLSGGQRQRIAGARAGGGAARAAAGRTPLARWTPRCARNCAAGCAGCTTSARGQRVRDARPGRGAGSGRPGGADELGPHRAGGHASRSLGVARHALRLRLPGRRVNSAGVATRGASGRARAVAAGAGAGAGRRRARHRLVRPHEFDIERYRPEGEGIAVRLSPTWPAPAPIWNWRARTRTPSSRPKCRNSCTGS